MDDFNKNLGKKLRKLRKRKNYSLSELEELTGVSKSMLGQIERGKSSPTVKTLWKISKGLNVSFSTFVNENKEDISIVSNKNTHPIIEKKSKYKVYPLFPYENEKKFEIYFIEIAANYSHEAEAHYENTEEYLLVNKGKISVKIDNKKYDLEKDEAINFNGDKPHIYENNSSKKASAYIIIYYA
ncbi:MAG: helix-turn-helix domain-containing protein [Bacillota bacterium]